MKGCPVGEGVAARGVEATTLAAAALLTGGKTADAPTPAMRDGSGTDGKRDEAPPPTEPPPAGGVGLLAASTAGASARACAGEARVGERACAGTTTEASVDTCCPESSVDRRHVPLATSPEVEKERYGPDAPRTAKRRGGGAGAGRVLGRSTSRDASSVNVRGMTRSGGKLAGGGWGRIVGGNGYAGSRVRP